MKKLLIKFFLISLISTHMFSLSSNTAVTGKIFGSDGKSLSGVKIIASSTKRKNRKIVVSNKKGSYRILNLIPGSYILSFQKEGYKTVVYANVLVYRVKKLKIPIKMELKEPNENNIIKNELSLIEVKKISPYSNGIIKANQKIFVWLSYRLADNNKEGVLIWVMPDSNKHASIQFSPLIKSKTGSISRYFSIKKPNVKIKEIWIRMMSKNKRTILYQETIKVNLTTVQDQE